MSVFADQLRALEALPPLAMPPAPDGPGALEDFLGLSMRDDAIDPAGERWGRFVQQLDIARAATLRAAEDGVKRVVSTLKAAIRAGFRHDALVVTADFAGHASHIVQASFFAGPVDALPAGHHLRAHPVGSFLQVSGTAHVILGPYRRYGSQPPEFALTSSVLRLTAAYRGEQIAADERKERARRAAAAEQEQYEQARERRWQEEAARAAQPR